MFYNCWVSDESVYRKVENISTKMISLNIYLSIMNELILKKHNIIQEFVLHNIIEVYC